MLVARKNQPSQIAVLKMLGAVAMIRKRYVLPSRRSKRSLIAAISRSTLPQSPDLPRSPPPCADHGCTPLQYCCMEAWARCSQDPCKLRRKLKKLYSSACSIAPRPASGADTAFAQCGKFNESRLTHRRDELASTTLLFVPTCCLLAARARHLCERDLAAVLLSFSPSRSLVLLLACVALRSPGGHARLLSL